MVISNFKLLDKERLHTTGGLAIWRSDEYILNFLFAIGL
jgi:hypothetical protein